MAPPVGRLIIGDFDGDAQPDLVLPTANAFYGYTVTRVGGRALLPVLMLILMAAISALTLYNRSRPAASQWVGKH
jgi:hypothetical protein